MGRVGTQALPVPDVVPSATGPWSSGWIPNRLKKLYRLGLNVAANPADLVILLGAATPSDPIVLSLGRPQGLQPTVPNSPVVVLPQADPLPPNALGQPYTGGAGGVEAHLYGRVSVCPWWQVIRYAPTPIAQFAPAPSTGAFFELIGEFDEDASMQTFAWQITLAGSTPTNLNPPAWVAGHSYAVGDVVVYPNGAYGMYTTGGVAGTTAPAPKYDQSGVSDGAAVATVTSPAGFANGIEWTNVSAGNVYTSSSPALSTTNGFGPIPNGPPPTTPKTQPNNTYLFSTTGGVITVAGFTS